MGRIVDNIDQCDGKVGLADGVTFMLIPLINKKPLACPCYYFFYKLSYSPFKK